MILFNLSYIKIEYYIIDLGGSCDKNIWRLYWKKIW